MSLFKQFSELENISEHSYLKNFETKMSGQANFVGQAVRLLYSNQSRILSVHLINLAPFNDQKQSSPCKESELGQM